MPDLKEIDGHILDIICSFVYDAEFDRYD